MLQSLLFRKYNAALVVFCIVITYSAFSLYGYHQDDEFGRFIGWYLYKLGLRQEDSLAIDYSLQMRPWVQTLFYYITLGPVIKLIGYQHFIIERITHVIHLFLFLFCLRYFIRTLERSKGPRMKRIIWFCALLWFVPSMAIRHSAETGGLLFMMLASYAWFQAEKKTNNYLLAGLLAGLSFYTRFNLSVYFFFFVAGYLAYEVFTSNIKIEKYIGFAWGVLFSLTIGLIIDFWGYGELTFSPYHYFYQNLIQGMASSFGTRPWYYFWLQAMAYTAQPLLWVFMVSAVYINRANQFTIATIAGIFGFFLVHSIIGHKEMRFIFPMVVPMAFVLIKTFQTVKADSKLYFLTSKWVWSLPIAINLIVLVSFTSQGLVRDKFQISLALKDLPNHTRVLTHSNLYGRSMFKQNASESHKDNIHFPMMAPKNVNLIAAKPKDFQGYCESKKTDYLLFTFYDILLKDDRKIKLVDEPILSVKQNPPEFMRRNFKDKKFYQKMWRYKLVTCTSYLQYLKN